MKQDSEKIKMYLNIGDQRILLNVPEANRNFVKETEREVEELYRKWRHNFPLKSDREILAMVAYQYASFYGELRRRYDTATAMADECLSLIEEETPTASDDYTPQFPD